jgi:hypothetical protein
MSNFDLHQFAGRRVKAVSADTRIAYSDYERMHRVRRSTQRMFPLPPWTQNDEMLKHVVKVRLWRYACAGHPRKMPADITMEQLEERIKARCQRGCDTTFMTAQQRQNYETHLAIVKGGHGWVSYVARLAWFYRLGYSSPEIAQELGSKPQAVRAQLDRLNRVAREYFPEHSLPKCTAKATRRGHSKRTRPESFKNALVPSEELAKRVAELHAAGKSVKEIAAELKRSVTDVKSVLSRAGMQTDKKY